MVNAVVLAGGKGRYYSENSTYRKKYGFMIPGELKAVRLLEGKPLVDWVIAALKNSKSIEDIIVVGNTSLLREAGVNSVKCVEQGNTIMDNVLRGYAEFGSSGNIFLAFCDTPKVTRGIDELFEQANGDFSMAITSQKYLAEYDLLLNRPYVHVINRNGVREGYRPSNMAVMNPNKIGNKDNVERAFKMRKFINPVNWVRSAYLAGLYLPFKYFITKNLSLEDIEKKASKKFECDFNLIEVTDPGANFDIDFKSDFGRLDKIKV